MKPCASCAFFRKDMNLPEARNGFCHRYPPSVFVMGQDFRTLFVPVREDFGCGEHKPGPPGEARKQKRAA